MYIPGEDVHSWWGTAPFPVRICIPGEAHPHSRWGWITVEETYSLGMHNLTGNGDVPHREWECASPGMNVLTWNAHSLYWVIVLIQSSIEEFLLIVTQCLFHASWSRYYICSFIFQFCVALAMWHQETFVYRPISAHEKLKHVSKICGLNFEMLLLLDRVSDFSHSDNISKLWHSRTWVLRFCNQNRI